MENFPPKVTPTTDNLLYECINLIPIEIHNEIASMGNLCFFDCESYTNFTIPQKVTLF